MLDPKTIMVAVPCHTGEMDAYCAGGLAATRPMYGNLMILKHVSMVNLARNMIVHQFMKSEFEWLVCIDADIGFSVDDMQFLLSETGPGIPGAGTPARINTPGLETDADALVTCEYSRKTDALDPARFGLGFTRIHRAVFQTLQNLLLPDGQPRLWQFVSKGEMYWDYFPCGPIDHQWMGEDMGFFHMCRLAEITPRVEQRTKLVHWGQKGYAYSAQSFGGQ